MPQKKTTEILIQHELDSLNAISNRLIAEMEADKIQKQEYERWQDSMSRATFTEFQADSDKNWYMQAQVYVVPSFISVIIIAVIFGFLVIIDSNRAQKENQKNKASLIDSLENT